VTRDSREVQHIASRRQCMEADGYETESTCARGLLEAAALKLRLAVEAVGATEGAWDGDDEKGEGGEGEADE